MTHGRLLEPFLGLFSLGDFRGQGLIGGRQGGGALHHALFQISMKLPQHFFAFFPLGHVAGDFDEALKLTGLVAQGGDDHVGPEP